MQSSAGDGFASATAAIARDDAKHLAKLIDSRAVVVDARERSGTHLLHLAADLDAPACILLLVSSGASLFAVNREGEIPLAHAARLGRLHAGRAFLDLDPAVRGERFKRSQLVVVDKQLDTPLDLAALEDRHEFVQMLLEAGADPLYRHAERESTTLERLVTSRRLPAPRPGEDMQAAHAKTIAAFLSHPSWVQQRQSAPGNWTFPDKAEFFDGTGVARKIGWLHAAARNCSAVAVEAFLRDGMPVDMSDPGDPESPTPLHVACFYSATECFDLLVSAGADINRSCAAGSPLCVAVKSSGAGTINPLITRLLALGCDPDAPSADGRTARQVAAGRPDIIAMFDAFAARRAIRRAARLRASPG